MNQERVVNFLKAYFHILNHQKNQEIVDNNLLKKVKVSK